MRGAASIDYLSSSLPAGISETSRRRQLRGEVGRLPLAQSGGFSLNASASRYQNFTGPADHSFSDQIRILHLPMVELNGLEQHLFRRRCCGAGRQRGRFAAERAGLCHRRPVGRLDIRPRIAMPVHWGAGAAARGRVHDTLYTNRSRRSRHQSPRCGQRK